MGSASGRPSGFGLRRQKTKSVLINENVEDVLRMGLSLKRRTDRRASDMSLITILRNPVVQKAFRDFLRVASAEELYLYWFSVNKYQEQCNHMDIASKKEKALSLYNTYVKKGSPSFVQMDSVTRDQIEKDLAITSKGTMGQKSVMVIDHAFEVSYMKIFHQLKFEYMPRFLVSEEFAEIEAQGSKTIFDGQADLDASRAALTEHMEFEYILASPHGVHRMKEFIFSGGGSNVESFYNDLIELLLDINNYHKNREDKATRLKRYGIILKRYGTRADLPCGNLHELHKAQEAKPCYDPSVDIFDATYANILDLMKGEFLEKFQASHQFQCLQADISSVQPPMSPSQQQRSLREDYMGSIPELVKFKTERHLVDIEQNIAEIEFDTILNDSLGRHYLKLFCRELFQEENLLYWCDVDQFENIEDEGYDSNVQSSNLQKQAEEIVEKYIREGSALEVNISKALRDKTIQIVEKSKGDQTVFQESKYEVYRMMHHGLWNKFKASPMFKEWADKRIKRMSLMQKKMLPHEARKSGKKKHEEARRHQGAPVESWESEQNNTLM